MDAGALPGMWSGVLAGPDVRSGRGQRSESPLHDVRSAEGSDMSEITLAEAIHIYENSRLQSEYFTPEGLTAAYVLGLSGLYALQAMGELKREQGGTNERETA